MRAGLRGAGGAVARSMHLQAEPAAQLPLERVQEAPPPQQRRKQLVSVHSRRQAAWPELDALENCHTNRVHCRQHVNPLKVRRPAPGAAASSAQAQGDSLAPPAEQASLQAPVAAPAWAAVYADPCRPLALDIGSGSGRFSLALGARLPGFNHLGLEIRQPLVERACTWAARLGLTGRVHFLEANATVNLANLLSSYPGALQLATVQFPDPHFKQRHKKREVCQASLVRELAALMPPAGHVFLQSDVEEAAAAMRDTFEQHGGGAFGVCDGAAEGLLARLQGLQARQGSDRGSAPVSAPSSAPHSPEGGEQSPCEPGVDGQGGLPSVSDGPERRRQSAREHRMASAAFAPEWGRLGWLESNPLGVPTEREIHSDGQPIYRVLLQRLAHP